MLSTYSVAWPSISYTFMACPGSGVLFLVGILVTLLYRTEPSVETDKPHSNGP